jgi:long-chain acyl-CoA synthetase
MYPDRLAFSCYGKEYTWNELNHEVNRISNSLKSLGINKGDRVAYMFRNCAETVLCFLATQKIGATALPINTHFLSGEISRIMDVTECKAVLFDGDFADTIREAAKIYGKIKLLVTTGEPQYGEHKFDELLTGSDTEAQVELSEDDESIIILTSGTTGTSKATVRTQKMMREYGQMLAIENDNSHVPEVALTHCPFFHTACLSILVKMLALCGTFVMVNKVDPEFVFDQLEKYKVTQILVVPPLIYMRLYESGLWKGRDLSSLREAQFTGGKCSKDYILKICEMFPNAKLRASYGSTETCAPCSIVASKEELLSHPERMTSVGHINANCELRIVDEHMNDVAVGQVGEAIVRSPMLFKGYLKNEELNKSVFTDGWFHTQDLMRRDEYGYYYLVDRIKDMIKSGGENVYAQEVEDVLRNHPAILDCAVIGVPDPKFEEAVAAAIVLRAGAELSDEDLLAYCRSTLPSYKKPRYVAYMDELPHNVTGKVQKSALRENSEQFRAINGL